MAHIGTSSVIEPIADLLPFGLELETARPSVLLVRGDDADNTLLGSVCEFLDLHVEHVSIDDEIMPMLMALRPAVIISDIVGEKQDGYHIMKVVADYDRDMPVLLLTDGDPALLGAIDAIQEIWGLSHVGTATDGGDIGSLVDFLCHAVRANGSFRMMRV